MNEIENDGYITNEADLRIQEPHVSQGFQREDKPYIEGYARGLEVAMKFCDDEQDPRSIRSKLENMVIALRREASWLV